MRGPFAALALAAVSFAGVVPASVARAAGPAVNACGCYRGDDGQCRCQKKGKCACPGDCEPVGCDEKRQKQMEKEAAAELKRAKEQDRKRAAQSAKAVKDQEAR